MFREEDKNWAKEIFQKFEKKMRIECERLGDYIPYIPQNGRYPDSGAHDIAWWTNGFYGGILWQLFHVTNDTFYKDKAEMVEKRLDRSLEEFSNLYHDVGFMWMHTAVANYRLTGNGKSFSRGMHAANILAGRYNILGKFIRAWNEDKSGWMIIDCLMNLSLLYWASEETNDPRFRAIAEAHAQTAMDKLQRPDGSCNHIAILDPNNGDLLELPAGQGYESGSSWSRGQSWAVYGFAISYAHTKDPKYLDAAKRVAHYFLAHVAMSDFLPLCDFRSPEEPVLYDSTAGACAACGMLEIAKHVPAHEKPLFVNGAVKMLQSMEKHFCNWNEDEDGILGMGKVAYHDDGKGIQEPIIYGDYFFLEAILRLMEQELFLW